MKRQFVQLFVFAVGVALAENASAQQGKGTFGFIMQTGANRLQITHLGVLQDVIANSSASPAFVGVWSLSDGSLLTSTVVGSGPQETVLVAGSFLGSYYKVALREPLDLAPNTRYAVGVSVGLPGIFWGNAGNAVLPSSMGELTITQCAAGGALAWPGTGGNQGPICPMVWVSRTPFSGILPNQSGDLTLQTSTNLQAWTALTNYTFSPPGPPGRFFRMKLDLTP